MKKYFILITLLVMMLPTPGNAQLNIKHKTSKIETIASLRAGYFSLKTDGSIYFIVTTTTNQFDDPFILYIGDGKDSALKTLVGLYDLCGNIEQGTSVVIDNAGKECRLHQGIMGAMTFHMDGYAGYASTTRAELNKLIKALNK